MSFTGNEDQSVTLTEAADLTKNYRDTVSSNAVIAHYFSRAAMEAILDQEDCVGVRIYYALNSSGGKQLVACGVYDNGDDIYQGFLADRTYLCPTDCGVSNPLNTDVIPST